MVYRFENCVLDIGRRELRRGEIVCPIEPQVFDLLHVLIANRDRVVSRDEIFRTVWQGRIVSESGRGNRINAVRKAIGDDGTQQRLIRTLRRHGFRFVGAVCEGLERSGQAEPNDAITLAARKLSLAVLPLSSGPADEELACVCKGIADDLTIALARSRSFDVIAHNRVCTHGDDPMRLAREFGAAYLVACGVRKASGELRLSVRLIEACTGIHIWARSYTQRLTTGFADQDAVTATIAAALEPYVFAAEARRRRQKPFPEFDATDCVLAALSTVRHRSPQNYALAHQLLARAIERDPACVRAYSIVAFLLGGEVISGWKPRRETIPLAIEAAHKALLLDDQDPLAHFALGWVLTQNRSPEQGIEEYQKAVAINTYFPSAHAGLGLALGYVGRIEKALVALDNAERLGAPEILPGFSDSARAGVYACAEKCGDAIKAARRSVQQDPGLVSSQRQIVVNCALAGEMEEARAAFKTFVKIVPNASLDSIAGALPYVLDDHLNRALDAFRLMGLT